MHTKWLLSLATLWLFLSCPLLASPHNNQLDYASTKDIADLNPHLYFGEIAAQNMIFESLVRFDNKGHIVPNLATHWHISGDGTLYRFNLRRQVRFNDGTPFDAKAVKLNFEAILANKIRHQWMGLVNDIQGIRIINDHTIELRLYAPYYPTLSELALDRPFRFISPAAFIQQQTAHGVSHYAGTGPWMLAEYKRNQYAKFVPNPYYWGSKPHLAAIIWHVIPDRATMLLALQRGDIQLIFGADGDMVDADSYAALAASGPFVAIHSAPIATRMLVLNSQRPITRDPIVRQAIAYAINKAEIAVGIFDHSEPIANHLLAPNVPYSNTQVSTYNYDLDKARQLLAADGWRLLGDNHIRYKQQHPLHLLFSYDTDNAAEGNIAELVQKDLKQIGIDVTILGEEKQAYHDRQKSGQFDLQYALSWGKPYDPASYIASFRVPAHADYSAQLGLADKPDIDRLITCILMSRTLQKRQRLYSSLFKRLAQDTIYIPLTYARTKAIYARALHGVHFNLSQYEIPFRDMYFGHE